jgi:glucokinase
MRILGVDVGGTTTRVGLFEGDSHSGLVLCGRAESATDTNDVADSIRGGIRALADSGFDLEVSACGIGLPEYVRDGLAESSMVVHFSADALEEIRTDLSRYGTDPTMRVESDVRCAALAEWHVVGDPGLSLLYISVGTGLSSAVVLPGGSLLQGAHGAAISLGEWPAPSSSSDAAEAKGNLEQFTSGRGIEHRYAAITGTARSAQEITERENQDVIAGTILREAGAALGDAVRRLDAVLDPGLIVIGGGLGSARTLLWEALESAALEPIPGRRSAYVRRAALGSRSGELGAALVAATS